MEATKACRSLVQILTAPRTEAVRTTSARRETAVTGPVCTFRRGQAGDRDGRDSRRSWKGLRVGLRADRGTSICIPGKTFLELPPVGDLFSVQTSIAPLTEKEFDVNA